MSRVKRSTHARKKRRSTLARTKGYRGEAHSSYRRAKEALLKADDAPRVKVLLGAKKK